MASESISEDMAAGGEEVQGSPAAGSPSSSSSAAGGKKAKGKSRRKRKASGSAAAFPYTPVAQLPDVSGPQALDISKVEVGHKFCNIETGTVLNIDAGYIHVKTEGGPVMIAKDVFSYDTYSSPDQYTRTIRTCKTGLVHILRQVGDHMFYVVFDKRDGTERSMYATMKGSADTDFGDSKVHWLTFQGPKVEKAERRVDHRTLKEVRFKGFRFVTDVKRAKARPSFT